MKYRHIINLLCVSTPICVLLRAIQVIFTLDKETGFVKQQYSQISLLITIIVCATVVAVGIMAAGAEDLQKNKKTIRPLTAAAALLTAGMFVYEMVASVSALGFASWHGVLLAILAIFSAVAFGAYGINCVYEFAFPRIIFIAPVIYYVIKLINLFVSTSALALVTENVFLLFTNSAILWFVFEFASSENGFNADAKLPKRLFSSSVIAIMLCTITALPKLILMFSQKSEASAADVSMAVLMLSQAFFVFAYTNDNYGTKNLSSDKSPSKHSA